MSTPSITPTLALVFPRVGSASNNSEIRAAFARKLMRYLGGFCTPGLALTLFAPTPGVA